MNDELPSPVETSQSVSETPPPPSRFAAAARAFWRGLLRLVVILGILAVVVVIVYLAAPLAYRELIMPVRDTSARLQAMETQNAADQGSLTQTLNSLLERINKLEIDQAALSVQQAGLQSGLDSLRQSQSSLEKSLARLNQLESELNALQLDQSAGALRLQSIEATQAAPQVQVEALIREVEALKAMNLLIRARLNLVENNFGLAKTDLQSARDVLLALRNRLSEEDQTAMNPWIERLDLALSELPASPVLAAGDLEIAYQLLAGGILPPTSTPGPLTPTPTAYSTETLAPFLIGPSETPTPYLSPTGSTSTPYASPTGPTSTPYQTVTPTPTPTAPTPTAAST